MVTDQESVATAVLATLNAIPGVDAYDLDEAPTQGRYVVIRLYRDEDALRRAAGPASARFFLETIYRAPKVQNCRELRRLVSLALDVKPIGSLMSVFNQETQPIDDDPDYLWSGVDTWSLI